MRKLTILVCALSILLIAAAAAAGPAPRLTKVQISAFTAQNYNYSWKSAPGGYPKSMNAYSFAGPELYMKVVYSGYPNWNTTFIQISGSQYTHAELFDQQRYMTNRGVIAGFEIVYKIPPAYLGSSNHITINSSGTNGGSASDVSTNVRFKE